MVIKKLKAGMTVYDVKKARGITRFNGKWQTWPVYIYTVNTEDNRVFASWNGNSPRWYSEIIWKKWRLKIPQE